MKDRFRAAKSFRRALSKLSPEEKRLAAAAFKIFQQNPFDPRLQPHRIHKMSAIYNKTIHAVEIAGDLRAAFYCRRQCCMERRYRGHRIIAAKNLFTGRVGSGDRQNHTVYPAGTRRRFAGNLVTF